MISSPFYRRGDDLVDLALGPVRHELKLNLLLSSCPTDEDAAGVDLHLLRVVVAAVSLHAYKVVVAAVVAVVVVAVVAFWDGKR